MLKKINFGGHGLSISIRIRDEINNVQSSISIVLHTVNYY